MPDKPEDKPKIIVDDDWKQQAQVEKEKLSEDVEKKQEQREIPPASLETLVSTMVTQVFMALGGYEDPRTKRRYVDLELAKHYIDTLAVLEEKTANNLTENEKKLLDQAIYECRMHYVQIAQRASGAQGG
ncbi:MAG: DUF1844 domain-containing protein [Proteiniphilum sp.]